jgi:hypothetical protein
MTGNLYGSQHPYDDPPSAVTQDRIIRALLRRLGTPVVVLEPMELHQASHVDMTVSETMDRGLRIEWSDDLGS